MKKRTAHEPSDSDQERLRRISGEIKAIMRREKLGGTITLVSQESGEWLMELPEWAGLKFEDGNVRVKLSGKEQAKGDQTMHFLATVREISIEYAGVFGGLYDMVKRRLEELGGGVDHVPWAGVGYGPMGRDKN